MITVGAQPPVLDEACQAENISLHRPPVLCRYSLQQQKSRAHLKQPGRQQISELASMCLLMTCTELTPLSGNRRLMPPLRPLSFVLRSNTNLKLKLCVHHYRVQSCGRPGRETAAAGRTRPGPRPRQRYCRLSTGHRPGPHGPGSVKITGRTHCQWTRNRACSPIGSDSPGPRRGEQ